MSDFDKEAERERLREKYERDRNKREATEKMSDLLLKGATMTNAHCEHCGDPIFRYEGQEFCPTCEQVVEDGTGDGVSDETPADGTSEETTPEATPADGTTDAAVDAETATGTDAGRTSDTPASQPGEAGAPATGNEKSAPGHIEIKSPSGSPEPAGGEQVGAGNGDAADGGIAAARESLVRTLVVQSRRAAACEDPRRARDHLAAAREAAEALSALPY